MLLYQLHQSNLLADYVASLETINLTPSQQSGIQKLAFILFTTISRNHIAKIQKIVFFSS